MNSDSKLAFKEPTIYLVQNKFVISCKMQHSEMMYIVKISWHIALFHWQLPIRYWQFWLTSHAMYCAGFHLDFCMWEQCFIIVCVQALLWWKNNVGLMFSFQFTMLATKSRLLYFNTKYTKWFVRTLTSSNGQQYKGIYVFFLQTLLKFAVISIWPWL